jgi:hypothetical protein
MEPVDQFMPLQEEALRKFRAYFESVRALAGEGQLRLTFSSMRSAAMALSPQTQSEQLSILKRLEREFADSCPPFVKDADWATIEGRECLVTAFEPMAQVDGIEVRAASSDLPYAYVRLLSLGWEHQDSGYVCHKTDFAMLWAAFRKRAEVPGTRLESGPDADVSKEGLGAREEVSLIWSRNEYKRSVRFLKVALPRLTVIVRRKGAFELLRTLAPQPGFQMEDWAHVCPALLVWKPDVIR